MKVIINNKNYELPVGATLEEALQQVLGTTEGMAAAVNGNVVPRTLWATHVLAEGDDIILIKAAYGG